MTSGTRPVAIKDAMLLPEIGIALKPHVPHPDDRKNRPTGVVPSRGE